jgi:hypothetical protein
MIRADARHIVAMFIRKATRKYKGRVYTNYQLVRSVQTPKRPRQKMICSLGDLSPRPAEAWRQLAHQVEDALQGQPGRFEGSRETEVEQIVRQVQARQAGPVHVGYQFWRRLGLDKAKRGYSRDHRPDCKQVVVGLVIGREGFPLAHEIFAAESLPKEIRCSGQTATSRRRVLRALHQ